MLLDLGALFSAWLLSSPTFPDQGPGESGGELTMEVYVPSPPCLFALHLSFLGLGEVWRSNRTLVGTCKRGHESLDTWLCPKTIKTPFGWNAEERGCRSVPFMWNKPTISPTCLVDFVLSYVAIIPLFPPTDQVNLPFFGDLCFGFFFFLVLSYFAA